MCGTENVVKSKKKKKSTDPVESITKPCVCVHTKPSLNLYLYTTTIPPLGGVYSFFLSRCWLVDLIVYTVPLLLLLPGMPTNKNTREENGLASGRARASGFCRVAIKVGPPQQKEAELNLKTLLLAPCAGFVLFFHVVPDMRGVTNQREEVYSIPYICPAIVYTLQSSMCAVYMYVWRVMGTAPPPFCYIGHAALSVLYRQYY
jgi:hypothetical protein